VCVCVDVCACVYVCVCACVHILPHMRCVYICMCVDGQDGGYGVALPSRSIKL